MKIETLTQLLKAKYTSEAYAYVPDVYGKQKRSSSSVCVVYHSDGKVYTYSGSILATAERLGLIPEIDCAGEAAAIVPTIMNGATVTGHSASSDTIRFALPEGLYMVQSNQGIDEYDRATCEYSVTRERPAWTTW